MTIETFFAYAVYFAAWLCFIFQKGKGVNHPRVKKEYLEDFKNLLNTTDFFMLLTAVLSTVPVFAYIFYKPALAYIDYMAAVAMIPAVLQFFYAVVLRLKITSHKVYLQTSSVIIFSIYNIQYYNEPKLILLGFLVLPAVGVFFGVYMYMRNRKIFK